MLFFQPVFLFVFLTESSLHLSARISREDFRPKVGSLLNRQLNADVLSPSAPAPSLIALLLYGWTERLAAVLPTKCGAVAVHAAAGREERRMASSASAGFQCMTLCAAERLPSTWSAPPVSAPRAFSRRQAATHVATLNWDGK